MEKKKGMSFSPELIGEGPEGEHVVKDANHFILLGSASNGVVFYIPRENAYYLNEGGIPNHPDVMKLKMPYLRWDFDQMAEEEILAEGADGQPRIVKLPPKSKFPPTPENIATKRKELAAAAIESGETPDMKAIYAATSPNRLEETEKFLALLDQRSADERLAARINRTL